MSNKPDLLHRGRWTMQRWEENASVKFLTALGLREFAGLYHIYTTDANSYQGAFLPAEQILTRTEDFNLDAFPGFVEISISNSLSEMIDETRGQMELETPCIFMPLLLGPWSGLAKYNMPLENPAFPTYPECAFLRNNIHIDSERIRKSPVSAPVRAWEAMMRRERTDKAAFTAFEYLVRESRLRGDFLHV